MQFGESISLFAILSLQAKYHQASSLWLEFGSRRLQVSPEAKDSMNVKLYFYHLKYLRFRSNLVF